jgi:hypothetical protein
MISFTIQPGFFSTRGLLGELLGRVDISVEWKNDRGFSSVIRHKTRLNSVLRAVYCLPLAMYNSM